MNQTLCSSISESDRDSLLSVGYSEAELQRIEPYFARMDGATPRAYLARVFYWGKRRRADLNHVIAAVEKSWQLVWKNGTPGRLGDPDDVAPGGVGMANIAGFLSIYPRIGLPIPKFPFN